MSSQLNMTHWAATWPFTPIRRCSTLTELLAMRGSRALAGREIPSARYQKPY